jgi:hypothetical protein
MHSQGSESEYEGRPIRGYRLATDWQLPKVPTVAAGEIIVLAVVSRIIPRANVFVETATAMSPHDKRRQWEPQSSVSQV